MNEAEIVWDTILLLLGPALIYLSRVLLWKRPKHKAAELVQMQPMLEGIGRKYWLALLGTIIPLGALLFALYKLDEPFWQPRVMYLFIVFFGIYALIDGLFPMFTNVFPATTRYNLDRFDTIRRRSCAGSHCSRARWPCFTWLRGQCASWGRCRRSAQIASATDARAGD